jgi:hypothetical protein
VGTWCWKCAIRPRNATPSAARATTRLATAIHGPRLGGGVTPPDCAVVAAFGCVGTGWGAAPTGCPVVRSPGIWMVGALSMSPRGPVIIGWDPVRLAGRIGGSPTAAMAPSSACQNDPRSE